MSGKKIKMKVLNIPDAYVWRLPLKGRDTQINMYSGFITAETHAVNKRDFHFDGYRDET